MTTRERAIHALLIEYSPGTQPISRWPYRDLACVQPGYRRRLDLQADGYRRLVDLCLFATPAAAEAALVCAARRVATAEGSAALPELAVALLVDEGDAFGRPTVVLRRRQATAGTSGQVYWRDRLYPAAPVTELW
jgi:hypothetical protein